MTILVQGNTAAARLRTYRPLGILRFLLAFCVFFAHSNVIYNPLLWAYPAVQYVELANIGVWGFFVVSGYIVVRALEGFYLSRPSAFLVNRALRIFPLFVASLIVAWAVPLLAGVPTIDPKVSPRVSIEGLGPMEFVLGITVFGFVLDANVFNPNTPSWTIYVEFIFYVLGALFFAVSTRQSPRFRAALFGIVVLAFAVFYFSAALSSVGVPRIASPFLPDQLSPPKYFPFFLLGLSIHCYFSHPNRLAGGALIFFAALWCGAFVAGVRGDSVFSSLPEITATKASNLVGMTVVGALLMLIASDWYSAAFTRLGPIFRKIDRLVGDFTYPLYLIHVPLLAALWLDTTQERSRSAWWLTFTAALVASAALLWLVDWPIQRWRDKFRGQALT